MRTKSIDTRYAGCHFRSRLEARWAKFFDALGVAWQYEPQGYEVDTGLDETEKPERYLPDFYLPHLGTFVEVKGDMAERDARRLCKAVIPHGLSLGATGVPAVIILGDIPRIRDLTTPLHVGLSFHKGDVWAETRAWHPAGDTVPEGGNAFLLGNDAGHLNWNHRVAEWLTEPGVEDYPTDQTVAAAYTAARSARFEFGA